MTLPNDCTRSALYSFPLPLPPGAPRWRAAHSARTAASEVRRCSCGCNLAHVRLGPAAAVWPMSPRAKCH